MTQGCCLCQAAGWLHFRGELLRLPVHQGDVGVLGVSPQPAWLIAIRPATQALKRGPTGLAGRPPANQRRNKKGCSSLGVSYKENQSGMISKTKAMFWLIKISHLVLRKNETGS